MVRFKNRYLVMEVFLDPNKDLGTDDPIIITHLNVSKAIKESILANFGECGLASSIGSLQVKYVNPITKVCIIRTSKEEYQKVWSAITMVRDIGNFPVVFNLLDLSDLFTTTVFKDRDSQINLIYSKLRGLSSLEQAFRDPFGSIRACKDAALKCDELKFENYKKEAGPRVTAEINQMMQNFLEKIKTLEL